MRSSRYEVVHPNVGLWLRTRIAKSRFARKIDMLHFITSVTFIGSKSHSTSTTKYFFYVFYGVWSYVTFVFFFENISIVFEYGFDRYMSGDNFHSFVEVRCSELLEIITFFETKTRRKKIVRNSRTILLV